MCISKRIWVTCLVFVSFDQQGQRHLLAPREHWPRIALVAVGTGWYIIITTLMAIIGSDNTPDCRATVDTSGVIILLDNEGFDGHIVRNGLQRMSTWVIKEAVWMN